MASILVFPLAALCLQSVSADTKDWAPPSNSTDWSLGANWGGSAPTNDLTTDIARFKLTDYTNKQPNAGTRSIAGIEIGDGSTFTGSLTISGANLSLGAAGITQFANSGTSTITSALTLGAAQTWTNHAASSLTASGAVNNGGHLLTVTGAGNTMISGVVTGAGGLIKDGAGTLTLTNGDSGFSGGLTVRSGTVALGGSLGFGAGLSNAGSGTITLGASSGSADATLVNTRSAANPYYTNNLVVAAGSSGTLTIANDAGNFVFAGSVALNNNLTLSSRGEQFISLGGAITGAGNITINNTGVGSNTRVEFGGDNSNFTGDINIQAGEFRIFGSNDLSKVVNASNVVSIGATGNFVIDYLQNQGTQNVSVGGLADIAGAGGAVSSRSDYNSINLRLAGGGTHKFSGSITHVDTNTGVGGADSKLNLIVGNGSDAIVQTLSGASTYTGTTVVNALATLVLDGSLTSDITVSSNAVFGGIGSTTGGLTMESAATFQFDLSQEVGELFTASVITLNTGALFELTGSREVTLNTEITVLSSLSSVSGTFG
ncbi:MAG: transporter, partial [Rariglobus sp.]|nr:transporter [Rariglobus sp.]